MKIGILTQSMAANYGCNLQAYALQTVLERMGHEVEILDRWDARKAYSLKNSIAKSVTRIFKDCGKLLLRRPIYHTIEEEDRSYYWQHFVRFQKEYLHLTCKHRSTEDMRAYIASHPFDGFVVGSDQVWRPSYNLNDKLYDMFLKFTEGQQVKRFSYAASFGVDFWEYTEEQTQICSELIKQFDAVSVREKSGVKLCHEHMGVKAEYVLDPTMLLEIVDYNALIDKKSCDKAAGDLFCYILDSSDTALQAMEYVEHTTGLKRFTCLPLVPENTYSVFNKAGSVLPAPEEWLRCFRDSKMVLVDSFHGMVFSIIYNKPFWVIGNEKRGVARFHSLLELFGLENRLVSINQLRKTDLNSSIDWSLVNAKREFYKMKSIDFLAKIK